MSIDQKFIPTQVKGAIEIKSAQDRLTAEKRKEMAETFEKVFARHLVTEMTKSTFESTENSPASFSHYRDHITETLSAELASQNRLGMAELLNKHWSEADK